jgi:hypothetical protein
MGDILEVVPSFLKVLASMQNEISGKIKTATNTVNGISTTVATTHGSYTDDFNNVLKTFETTRASAGTGLQGFCTQLATNLVGAATSYLNTDMFNADALKRIFS